MLGGGSHVWIFSSIANVSSLPELGPEVSGYLDPGLVFLSMKINLVSDMDVAECERQRFDFIDDLTDLEKQFAILREQ